MRVLPLIFLVAACGGDHVPPAPRAPGEVAPRRSGDPAAPDAPPAPPAPPALAAAPRIDLLANRARWHLHDRGLVIPVASEGLRKYALEYKSPWGDVRDADGQRGRALKAGKATLTFPWEADGAAQVIVRARGKGKLTVAAGKHKLGGQTLDGTWQELVFDVDALPRGEVALAIGAGKGTLIHDVEIAAPGATGCGAGFPALSPVQGDALGGVPRMSILVEVPAEAYLVMTPHGTGAAKVIVTSEAGAARTLLDAAAPSGEQLWPLDDFAGALVRLDVEAPACDVTWSAPAIAVAARPDPAPRAPARNVVLLVIDALRADHLAVNGDTRVVTPRITAAATARGWVFRDNQSMAPSSPPSHATIHTGQIPRVHGAIGDTAKVNADAPVLAAILGDAGFYTGYVGDNDFAMGKMKAVARWDEDHTPIFEGKGLDCAPLIDEALEVLGRARDSGKRIFLTALPIEPHVPYRYHDGVTERYYPGPFDKPLGKRVTGGHLGKMRAIGAKDPRRWDQLRGLYDGEVEHMDGCFGQLEDGLAAAGLADDTAIVITSDHGEGMGERGGHTGHAYGLHGELIHVPLIVLGGGVPAGATDVVTSNADIAPTILDLLGLPPDPRMQGQSVLPIALAGGPWPARVIASEYGRAFSIRGGRWRLVTEYDGTATLHDVTADPEEATDVSAASPMARAYLREAAGLYLAHRVAWRAATWGTLTDIAATSPLAGE